MQLSFHGAAQTVTGSKHLITLENGTNILLDCGLFQGLGSQTEELNQDFGFHPSSISYVILSHAHIDHCGLLPKLVAEGFNGPIFSTAPTMDLARILLLDSAKIQEQDAEYLNRHLEAHEDLHYPLYTENDVINTISKFKIVEYNEVFHINEDISFVFTDAGHILGSAAIHLSIIENGKETKISFSGDVGRYGDLLLKNPQVFNQSDYIILESTYGDKLHKDTAPVEDSLYELIRETCVINKGKLIIPAFSVGRTQELLFALNSLELKNKLPDLNYYVDSPLSAKATAILKNHPDVYNNGVKGIMRIDEDIFNFKGLRFVENVEESKALNNDARPCVIISSSGMADSGRVKHHIKNTITNKKNTILIVGYAEPRSLAGRLVSGAKEVQIFKNTYFVQANIQSLHSMSAHGDRDDLLQFLANLDPKLVKKIFLVHGVPDVQNALANSLEEKGFKDVIIPSLGESFTL